MRRHTCFFTMAFFAITLTFAAAGCKGKKTSGAGTAGGTETPKTTPKTVKPQGPVVFDMAARKKIADNATYTKRELYKTFAKKIPEVAETCRKSKKYASSLSWCTEFKALKEEADKIFKEMKSSEPKTIRRGMAIVAACAKHLKDESLFVRFTALELVNWAAYRLSYAKASAESKDVRRLLGWVYKHDKDKQARQKAIDILGNDGGVVGFRGDAQDARVLFVAASKDPEMNVRRTALSELNGCVKKPAVCPLKPKQLVAWYAKESDASNKQTLAGLAGHLKMAKEVLAWCKEPIEKGTLYWGCTRGLKQIANKETADALLGLAKAFIASDVSKKKDEFRTKYLAEIMVAGVKQGLPKDKAVAFLVSVLEQPETTTRSTSTTTYIVAQLAQLAAGKDEAKQWAKLIKKAEKRYKKAWGKDKSKKSSLKAFAEALKTLKGKSA